MNLGPEFAKLWAGQSVSRMGSQISAFALPTYAVIVLQATPPQAGALTALQFLPFPVLGLFAGVWADRIARRRVMIVADLVRFLAIGSIPAVAVWGASSMYQLYAVALMAGTASVFFDISYQAYLPEVVQKNQLTAANARLEFSSSAAQIAGNAAGGVLIGAIGAAMAIALDACSYLISVVSLLLIRSREPARKRAAQGSFLGDLGEGLRYVWNNRNLRSIALCTALSNLGSSIVVAVEFIFFYRNLHLSPVTLGLILGFANVGFVGAFFAGRIVQRFGKKHTLITGIGLANLAALCTPLAQYTAPLLIIFVTTALQAIGSPIYNITQVSWRQAAVPDHLHGRMNATVRTFVWGTLPLGAAIGGFLGNAAGIVPTIYIGASVSLLGVFALFALDFKRTTAA